MSAVAQDPSAGGPPTPAPTQSAPTQEQMMALFAIRVRNDHDAMRIYAAVLAGVMGLFIISHLLSSLGRKSGFGRFMAIATRPFVSLKRLLLSKVLGAPSLGHAAVFLAYLGLNVGFIFVFIDDSVLPLRMIVAARTGWLAVANICLTVFLSLKNTPLGYLTGWSYERLNSLHRVTVLTTFVLVVVHAASYSSFFLDQQNAARLRVNEEIYGIVAGFTLLMVVTVALTLQRRRYELFYVLHVFFFVASLVFICLHHPTATERVVIAIGVAAGMWFLDRLVRASRLAYHSINNTATLTPLPNGGTRVVLSKRLLGGRSGEHAFLWIPGIRWLETHPFTVVNTEPLEFVIAAQDGFTRDLHQYATKNPGAVLRASVEGPYGQIPNPAQYNKALLFAGGSGASFAFGSALQLLRDFEVSAKRDVTLIWVLRHSGVLGWFSDHLETIAHAQGFRISIYITGQTELEKMSLGDRAVLTASDRSEEALTLEASLEGASSAGLSRYLTHGVPVHYGRPDVGDVIARTVEGMASDQNLLIMGCGPAGLLREVRKSATSRMGHRGPRVSLHSEQFGW
ncbi:ferric reductase like transmembrane component [Fusarium albosuccineum]|uniref:Ferric reductase like transmembrane component n=1 Tax=Fusarium albosuccineum TaxID=1237068 RepID=A0A8H4P5T8_9HYPO|nr:ferric reductase like transmembrane component [Fusarium albosuccineum]